MLQVFLTGLVAENLVTYYAVGLAVIVLFSYTFSESVWVGIRIILFVFVQTIILLLIRSWFQLPGKSLFLITFLIGTEVLFGGFFDALLPWSRIEEGLVGFIKRGDVLLPMIMSTIISKKYNVLDTFAYSFGLSIGFMLVLVVVSAIGEKYSFHRFPPTRIYSLRLFVVGIIAMLFQY
ncbi:MAG: Rnf-Nqr domain containing protein [Brevinemataceae bacterium]